ncbi:hypothetical protein HPB52_001244 [Rhipicephalus sanguineus]|uniref:DDE Tnp4 domain-containing protein n=1 Tax=Rhipicephalus sanguineus TaxID=34632 RepID=A0A9D4PWA9_RHISA|nr:hypothetical protein HPB52_001244 [Rhipicephalus sanguineus]
MNNQDVRSEDARAGSDNESGVTVGLYLPKKNIRHSKLFEAVPSELNKRIGSVFESSLSKYQTLRELTEFSSDNIVALDKLQQGPTLKSWVERMLFLGKEAPLSVGTQKNVVGVRSSGDAYDLPDVTQAGQVMEEFYRIANFPGVTGCIDCTHVKIKSPGGDDAEVFRCRKGYFSINVQVRKKRDLGCSFLMLWPAGPARTTTAEYHARVRYEQGDVPGLLLGDMGYACHRYLMTPLKDPENAAEFRYNRSHKKTRCSVERAFGIWKRRFPCLDMRMQIKATTSALVITACAALHNFSRHLNDPLPQDDQVVQPQSSSTPAPAAAHGSAAQPSDALPPGEPVDTEDGFRARRRIIRDYYTR